MALSNVLGFPRIGEKRELKFATEAYWRGEDGLEKLESTARELRARNWRFQQETGVDLIPSNDFSYYDQVLDTIAMVGAVPERYEWDGEEVDIDTCFAMARGRQEAGIDVTAMEMTKWFDTNYHYIVPELTKGQQFTLSSSKVFNEFQEALEMGITTKPVLVGPLTLLLKGKPVGEEFDRLELLDSLVGVYVEVIDRLGDLGAEWVQIDEPVLVEDREPAELDALRSAYRRLGGRDGGPKLIVQTYFEDVGEAYETLADLPVDAIGLDLQRGSDNLDLVELHGWPEDKALVAGTVDGRNVWINDLERSLDLLETLSQLTGGRVIVSSSCSLLHSPIDKTSEPSIDAEISSWMSFAKQKVGEIVTLTRGVNDGRDAIADELNQNQEALSSRRESPRTRNPRVRERIAALTEADARRLSRFESRREAQRRRLELPPLPATTIGSFPQTAELRQARAELREARIDRTEYENRMKEEIKRVIELQEDIGLDVFVHGEPERNDMVQYFAEQMDGYVFTENAWVQSYGSRYVRPPIIYGDIERPQSMSVRWFQYAQSLTDRPVKGMLTGPVTMLMWSFVRDDQPRSETCRQLALAIRDEVVDLEAAGARVVQVDEPAIREGLPLRRVKWPQYLSWAVLCFRLSTSGVRDETQIHTHMCYSEFGDILESISEMDADVLLIEANRSKMELLGDWQRSGYDKEIGPGVYDIHSPRVPSVEEVAELLRKAAGVLATDQLWVNPDCGLKTRTYDEAEPALKNMVQAARQLREELIPAKA